MKHRKPFSMEQTLPQVKVGFSVTNHYSEKIRPNGRELLKEYLVSVQNSCKYPFEIFIIDNQSENMLDESKLPSNFHYHYVKDQSIGGLTHAWNLGIREAVKHKCDVIFNTNEDLIINESINDFVSAIWNHKYKNVSIYGPVSNDEGVSTHHQRRDEAGTKLIETTNDPWDGRQGYALNGFFYGFTRTMVKKFWIDENLFSPEQWCSWNGQEIEIHDRCWPLGMRSFIAEQCFVEHMKLKDWQHFRSC